MKKLLISTILIAFIFVAPISTFADTTATTSVSSQIQSLLAQIQNLQNQVKALQALQLQVQTTKTSITSTLQIMRNLREGMSGDDVIALQTALASDPSIYPQGVISGYYGKQTADALRRFQKKHGFEQVGYAGPKTLQKLNEMLLSLGLLKDGNKLCVAPDHLVAQGWLRKNNLGSAVSLCNSNGQVIVTGNNQATTTPVITNVVSASVVVGGTIHDIAHLISDNAPTGTISFNIYGPNDTTCLTPLSPAPTSVTVNGNGYYNSGNFTTTSVGTYHFIATYSGDLKNYAVHTNCNDVGSSVAITAVPDTTAPVITALLATPAATTTAVFWTTDELATSAVWFSTTTPLSLTSSTLVSSSTPLTNHSLLLSGLATSTPYYYEVVSADSSGNTATSTQNTFTTTSGL